jgi:flagella basal body P-ring formation protein FlgA
MKMQWIASRNLAWSSVVAMLLTCHLSLDTSAAVGQETLRIRGYSRINDVASVRLFDLVENVGLSDGTRAALQDMTLGNAPQFNERRVYSSKIISELIRQNPKLKSASVLIPREVVVENKGFLIDQKIVEQKLLEKWNQSCVECKFHLKDLSLPVLTAKQRSKKWQLEIPNDAPKGQFSVKLILGDDGETPTFLWISGKLEVQRLVPTAKLQSPSGRRLNENEVQLVWKNVTYATDSVASLEEIKTQQLKVSLRSGDIIWRGSLMREKAVKRGDVVRVTVKDDNWQVSLEAQTQQDGFIGDTINLKNLATQKLLTGRVVGMGEVEIQ